MDKLTKLVNLFPEDLDAALIVSRPNRLYLTGFDSTLGYVLVSREGSFYLLDSRYYEEAKNSVSGCEVVKFTDAEGMLKKIAEQLNIKTIAIENEGISFASAKKFTHKFSDWGLKPIYDETLDKLLFEMRAVKDKDEIEKIATAQDLNDRTFEHILAFIKPGATEREIAIEMEFFARRNGAEKVAFDFIVVSGANSALPHGKPTGKKIAYGDFLTMDFGFVLNGYNSDMTRTVAVSGASNEMEKVYNTVLQAQLLAISAIRNGVPCKEVDKAARDYIYSLGYEGYFGHGTGHCIGVDIHERPRCSATDKNVLKTNMVTSVEPGIYIPNKFGVRIEDLVVVTDDGCVNLTKSPKELMIV